jgi:7-carboxy-7-deazaguanine synthase
MAYTVKEIFYSVQGEGANIGRPAVFIRFAGCNLWSGKEADRATATCRFCDTEFVGGTRWSTFALADAATALWPAGHDNLFTILTGGEPLLQVDLPLIVELKRRNFQIAIETNGTRPIVPGIDWVCLSPKASAPLAIRDANEIKLVFPQPDLMPDRLPPMRAQYRWLSPMAGPNLTDNTRGAVAWCLAHPEWRLAIQAHKFWAVP